MEQRFLCALLQLHRSTFQIIHWYTMGKGFDSTHKITNLYYEKVAKDLDDVAEILLRQKIDPETYFSIQNVLDNEKGRAAIDVHNAPRSYYFSAVVKACDSILSQILDAILDCINSDDMKDPRNIGIKSYYESLYNEYDKEYRFINRSRRVE